MSTPEIRVNARLTGEDARLFKELQERHQLSVTDVLRKAIRGEHQRTVKPRKSAYRILLERGLIGSIKGGPKDASSPENIRKVMDKALRKKYPQHYRNAK